MTVSTPLTNEKHNNLSISPSSPNETPISATASPSPVELEELLLDCRYGELDSVRSFVEKYSIEAFASARDDRGNSPLHMCAANGHDDILEYLLSLPNFPPSLLTSGNDSGNTPLHWACLNAQLACTKRLVAFRSPSGKTHTTAAESNTSTLGPALILAQNNAGQTPLGEAERAGWDEGARWLVSVMDLQLAPESSSAADADSDEEIVGDDGTGAGAKGIDEIVKRQDDGQTVEAELAQLRVSEDSGPRS